MLSFPIRTERTIFANGEIRPFFVRTADILVTSHDGLDAVLGEELVNSFLHSWILRHIRSHPSFDDRFRVIFEDDASNDFRRRLVVRTVESDRADGKLRRFLRTMFRLVFFNGRVPFVQFRVRKKMLVFFRHKPTRLFNGVNDGRV